MARPEWPEETRYRLARALHKGEPALAARLPQAAEATVGHTGLAAPDRDLIHPGVPRYLEEIGELAWRWGGANIWCFGRSIGNRIAG